MAVFRSVVIAAGLSASLGAQAAALIATSLSAGFSFVQYTGSVTVGIGAVDTTDTLFYIDEKTVGGEKSC